jgi:hypothetical protein
MSANHRNAAASRVSGKVPPPGVIVTDMSLARAGDVVDLGEGARYRYVRINRAPVFHGRWGRWEVAGCRWLFSRQSFTTSALLFFSQGSAP